MAIFAHGNVCIRIYVSMIQFRASSFAYIAAAQASVGRFVAVCVMLIFINAFGALIALVEMIGLVISIGIVIHIQMPVFQFNSRFIAAIPAHILVCAGRFMLILVPGFTTVLAGFVMMRFCSGELICILTMIQIFRFDVHTGSLAVIACARLITIAAVHVLIHFFAASTALAPVIVGIRIISPVIVIVGYAVFLDGQASSAATIAGIGRVAIAVVLVFINFGITVAAYVPVAGCIVRIGPVLNIVINRDVISVAIRLAAVITGSEAVGIAFYPVIILIGFIIAYITDSAVITLIGDIFSTAVIMIIPTFRIHYAVYAYRRMV